MWLDFAFNQAKRRKQIFLRDWQTKLDEFLRFNERDVLDHAGKVTKQEADESAKSQYDGFAKRRRIAREEREASESIKALEALSKEEKPE
nr:RhuM family protein [Roseibacillus ishigakijimensis]